MFFSRRAMLGLCVAFLIPGAPVFAQTGSVAVYTAHKSSIVEELLPLFEQETGLKAEVVKLGSGDIARRVRAEAARPAADVIWSIAGGQMAELAPLLEPYLSAEAEMIDPKFGRPEGWTPYTALVDVLAANTDLLAPEEIPKSWAALRDPKWRGRIAAARADGSGSALQQLQVALAVFGEEGWEAYAEIAKNFVFTNGSGAVPRFVADGEAALGLTLEDNALDYLRGGAPIALIYLEDGTAVTPDGVALVKGGPNPEGGKAFIDWALSKPVQERLAQKIGRRSVRLDVAGPPGAPDLAALKRVEAKPLADLGGAEAVLAQWRAAVGE